MGAGAPAGGLGMIALGEGALFAAAAAAAAMDALSWAGSQVAAMKFWTWALEAPAESMPMEAATSRRSESFWVLAQVLKSVVSWDCWVWLAQTEAVSAVA